MTCCVRRLDHCADCADKYTNQKCKNKPHSLSTILHSQASCIAPNVDNSEPDMCDAAHTSVSRYGKARAIIYDLAIGMDSKLLSLIRAQAASAR